MLVIAQRALEDARTPDNSCHWLAKCTLDGQRFDA
jgi:hypothetical protein